jgi:endonuclease/exonuclease/phosphatase family metal-dependent hydrolase
MGNTQYQIAVLAEKINKYREKYQCPAVLVGDLNTDDLSRRSICDGKKGGRHAHDIATK